MALSEIKTNTQMRNDALGLTNDIVSPADNEFVKQQAMDELSDIAKEGSDRNNSASNKSNSIFKNHLNVFNLSDPQPNWLFDIEFFSDSSTTTSLTDLIPINMSLPAYETSTVTKYFLGTEKTYAVYRTYGGESEMSFYMRCERIDNEPLKTVSNIFQTRTNYKHYEFDQKYNKINIMLKDKKGNVTTTYVLYNVIFTNVSFSEIGYEEEDKVQMTITIHYDFWECV